MKRPPLSILAASADTIVQKDVIMSAHGRSIARRSEAELLADHMRHVRDFVAVMAAHPKEVRMLMDGVQLVPASAVYPAAAQIAEEGGE